MFPTFSQSRRRTCEAAGKSSKQIERSSSFNKGAVGLTPAGFFVEFVIHQAFSINVTFGGRVQLWTYSADDTSSQYLVHDGDVGDAKVWEGLLKEIGRVEKFGVLIPHADKLRQMWSSWLVEQQRRRDDRGW